MHGRGPLSPTRVFDYSAQYQRGDGSPGAIVLPIAHPSALGYAQWQSDFEEGFQTLSCCTTHGQVNDFEAERTEIKHHLYGVLWNRFERKVIIE